MAVHTFAAIDVGSYELELKIFEVVRGKGIRTVDSLIRSIPLGEDTYNTGKISYHHVREVARILQEFSRVMKNYRVEEYKAYGTSAIREMENASLVLSQWEQQTGIHIDVLSNSEQRFLDYKSIASKGEDFDRFISDSCAIVDIGGGSVQISLFNNGVLDTTQNLRFGILRMLTSIEQVNARLDQKEQMVEEMVNSQLNVFRHMYLENGQIRNIIIIDDYISALMGSQHMEYATGSDFDRFFDEVHTLGRQEIIRRYHIRDDVYDLILISGIVARCIIRNFGSEKLWVPGVTLCDGIVYEYAERRKILPPSHDFEEDILASAKNISARYRGDTKRGATLESICLKIFDATKKIHGMDKRARLLLRLSAILHDCGKFISLINLAECSYNIIMSTEIIGLSHIEREIVANVVQYNHEEFVYYEQQESASDLDRDSYLTIARLTAILRVANGLDRSHKRKFGDLRVSLKDDEMVISVSSGVDITLEKGLFSNRAAFFEEVFGVRPVIRQRKHD